jgi:hypothetical protein
MINLNISNIFEYEPRWKEIIESSKIIKKKNINNKILIAVGAGGLKFNVKLETLIGTALAMRNASVEFLICNKLLDGCLMSTIDQFKNKDEYIKDKNKKLCNQCFNFGDSYLTKTGLSVNYLGNYINQEFLKKFHIYFYKKFKNFSISNLEKIKFKKINIGEHAKAGALRFLAKGELNVSDKLVLLNFVKSSFLSYFAFNNLLKKKKFDLVFLNHGIYVPQGIFVDVAKLNKVKVVTWSVSSRKSRFIFSHKDTYHRTLLNEPVSNWENIQFHNKEKKMIQLYIKSREIGKNDWIYFHNPKPDFNIKKFFKKKNITQKKFIVTLLTNVIWDAQLHFQKNIFITMMDWIIKTINFYKNNNNFQLVIRVHPAELTGSIPSNQSVIETLREKNIPLSKNIFLVGPEDKISTYALCKKSDLILIYGTKMGFEVATFGKPIIAAGEAWVKNKKISYDPKSKKEYFKMLEKSKEIKISKARKERALRYAFHYFFRRSIAFNSFEYAPEKKLHIKFTNNSIKNLINNLDPGLNLVCDSILNDNEFIFKTN